MRTIHKLCGLIAMSALLLLAGAGTALAGGATVTRQAVKATSTMPFTDPCTGQTGTATISYIAVLEQTDRPDGTFSLVNNFSGDFVLMLDSGTTITGHFVDTFVIGGGENLTLSNVLTARGTASDGSPFALHFQVIKAENGLGILIVDLSMC
jgi:hypothetical protein